MKKEDIYKLSAVEIYKIVLKGKILRKFPDGFWANSDSIISAKEITKWLIEEKLELSEVELKEQLSAKLFKDNKLASMLYKIFDCSPYNAINIVYPNKFKPWDFKNVPRNYWNLHTAKEATKWLIEEKLKLSDDQLKEQLSQKLFIDNRLSSLLTAFNSSPYNVINNTYPNKFKPWEFKNVPINYWTLDTGREATKWLIEEKLKLSDNQLKEQLSQKLFIDNGLCGMLYIIFDYSPYNAINNAYPNKFKPWEFNSVPINYWTLDTAREATKWLIEEKLKLSDEQLKEQLSVKLFVNNGLNGMINALFNSSPYSAINNAYPNKFKKSDFKAYCH